MNIKLYIYAAAFVLVTALAVSAYKSIGDARESKVRQEQATQLDQAKEATRHAEENARTISEKYELQLSTYKSALSDRTSALLIATRAHPIRLCVNKPASGDAGATQAAATADDTTSRDGQTLRASDDISAALVQYAARAESDRQTIIGWQAWYREQLAGYSAIAPRP